MIYFEAFFSGNHSYFLHKYAKLLEKCFMLQPILGILWMYGGWDALDKTHIHQSGSFSTFAVAAYQCKMMPLFINNKALHVRRDSGQFRPINHIISYYPHYRRFRIWSQSKQFWCVDMWLIFNTLLPLKAGKFLKQKPWTHHSPSFSGSPVALVLQAPDSPKGAPFEGFGTSLRSSSSSWRSPLGINCPGLERSFYDFWTSRQSKPSQW